MAGLQTESGNILIVDDTPLNLHLLSKVLTNRGYTVQAVLSGTMALSVVQTSPPELILLDVCMAEMDGYMVCQQLKANAQTRDIPVIFLSALDEALDKVRAFDVGAVDYITKPFHVAEVLSRVRNHLKLRRLQQQLQAQNSLLQKEIEERRAVEAALALANQQLQSLVRLDGLTQVANRRYFDQCLEQEWQSALREQRPLSLILSDVDFFKAYNDTYGHLAGDSCLLQVTQVLQAVVKRPRDVVARYGGEEFVLLLPNTTVCGALHLATEIQAQIQALRLPHQGSVSGYVSLSLGIAGGVPSLGSHCTELVFYADQALYQAKKEGRDRIVISPQPYQLSPDLPANA